MYFWTYGLRKTWLDKYLNSNVSEDPARSNKVKGPIHCSKLQDSTFTIFIDPCERNSGWRNLSKLYVESEDCLLTHLLLIKSILFFIETIYSKIFRSNYLRNETYFVNFFLHFENLGWIFNIFIKRMTLRADVYLNLRTRKEGVRKMSRKSFFREPFDR